MIEHCTCNSFNDPFKIKDKFSLFQNQLVVAGELKLKPERIEYKCEWHPTKIDSKKPSVAIPIRNCSSLLKYTLDNFSKNNMFDLVNVIIVDDRSQEDLMMVTKNYPVSFLKTFNNKGFNFSMLNNIAALISHTLGGKTFILWNSDLWIDNIKYFQELLQLHNQEGSTISGSKLVYPIESLHEDGHSDNIKNHFPNKLDGSYKDTVQFGGSRWIPMTTSTTSGPKTSFFPHHFRRFDKKTSPRVNSNYATDFVTGALQVIDLDWFIESGGLNPSLPKNYQDVDLCLKAIVNDKKVMYFGKNIHFYHDESFTFYTNKDEQKVDSQLQADQALFAKLWSKKINEVIF